ncbi:hypothetical protein C8F01DRAFT_1144912 [Mycena amicta]|nr:hypothetical protein C8F01DRAFT_1144912 [Mycena amicta]
MLSRFYAALRLCTGISSLAVVVTGVSEAKVHQDTFSMLEFVHLRRLSSSLHVLMPEPILMDAFQPRFRFLTHLESFDRFVGLGRTHILTFLVNLPSLTHLAFSSLVVDADSMASLLSPTGCAHLQVLVLLLMSGDDPELYRIWTTELPANDPRVVISVFNSWDECILRKGRTYWCEAEKFVEKKKQGLISVDCFWTGDFHKDHKLD